MLGSRASGALPGLGLDCARPDSPLRREPSVSPPSSAHVENTLRFSRWPWDCTLHHPFLRPADMYVRKARKVSKPMIAVTRLNGNPMVLNSDLIKIAEASPDTMLTLISGEKLIVRETCAEVTEG